MENKDALLERFKVACDLKQQIDKARIESTLLRWLGGISSRRITVRFVERYEDAARAARAARDARDARDARAARAAWDAVWEISWLATIVPGAAEAGNQKLYDTWVPLLEALEAGAFCLWITDTEIVVATLPRTVRVDDRRRLHADNAPAFEFLDGKDYWHHGVYMPADVYEKPGALTVKRVMEEGNAEVRRAMISLYGRDKFMADAGATVVEHLPEDYPVVGLRDARLLNLKVRGDDWTMIDLRDMAIQPDGSKRRYMFRVNPAFYGGDAGKLAHAAAASIHRKPNDRSRLYWSDWREYAPAVET